MPLLFLAKILPKSQRQPHRKNIEANAIMGVCQHMMVTAARITLRWRPGSKRIPSIDSLVFVHQQEIANQEEAEILQYVQSFKLARVHI